MQGLFSWIHLDQIQEGEFGFFFTGYKACCVLKIYLCLYFVTCRWIYVSNSEVSDGGVGAIKFNSDGQVINYEMIPMVPVKIVVVAKHIGGHGLHVKKMDQAGRCGKLIQPWMQAPREIGLLY